MTKYTLRDAATMEPVAREATLETAVGHLDCERLAFALNPPPETRELELVITADEISDELGGVIVRYSAGQMESDSRA